MRSRTVSVFAVEIAGWFIGQEQRRPIGQAAGDGDALAFAAGKFGGEMIESMLEADQLQQFDSALASLGS